MRVNRQRCCGALILLVAAAASAASVGSARGPMSLGLPSPVLAGVRLALARSPLRRVGAVSASVSTRKGAVWVPSDLEEGDDLESCGIRLVGATLPGEERRYDVVAYDDEEGMCSVSRRSFVASSSSSASASASQKNVRLCGAAVARPPTVPDAASPEDESLGTKPPSVSVAAGGAAFPTRRLHFWENMICGAISRSVAQTIMHPANTMKTLMQANRDAARAMTVTEMMHPRNFKALSRGAGAQFTLSVPHGAVNFAVLEYVRRRMNAIVSEREMFGRKMDTQKFGPALDFLSSCISTICCSIVSTPQMMITDNIMAGTYPNLPSAVSGLAAEKGIAGFYSGWWPGLAGKIPSYALTWTLFQQLKEAQLRIFQRPPKDIENSIMGCMASATTVCIMIPMDTIKTRLVTQLNYPNLVAYKGIGDAAVRIAKEEGIGAFYRGLAPRLVSVVPMIGIQFGVYEFMKKVMLSREGGTGEVLLHNDARKKYEERMRKLMRMEKKRNLEEVAMEVAADDEQPFPAPHFDEERFKALEKKAGQEAKKSLSCITEVNTTETK